jgi:uncharacterized protein YcbK (DUF882 family)
MLKNTKHSRRTFLHQAAKLVVGGAAVSSVQNALAAFSNTRSLAFNHTHTGERISLVYAIDDQYVPSSLTAFNNFLRDHYSGEVGAIDPQLFDLLFRIKEVLGCNGPFDVISGYRCPATNSTLRNTRGGGVAKRSLHMDGKAIDIRLASVSIGDLRDAALSLRQGGVGFYQREQFVHVDTGGIRSW